jgi:BRO family, N-terminal domain
MHGKEVVEWSRCTHDEIRHIAQCILGESWTLGRAIMFVEEGIHTATTIADLTTWVRTEHARLVPKEQGADHPAPGHLGLGRTLTHNAGIQMEMNDQRLKKFEFHGSPIRTVMIKKARDAVSSLPQKGAATTGILTDGGIQKVKIVNEANLYRLIFRSRKPEVEKFTDWVTGEVLPQIRKIGRYSKDVSPWALYSPIAMAQDVS